MSNFACNKEKNSQCQKCGDCCHIRESIFPELNQDIRKRLYNNYGILYPLQLNTYTININSSEKKVLLALAKHMKLELSIKPKKIVFDKNQKLKVVDWFLDHKTCPFYTDTCTIYENRPKICRDFPKTRKKKSKEYLRPYDFESALNMAEFFIQKYTNTK